MIVRAAALALTTTLFLSPTAMALQLPGTGMGPLEDSEHECLELVPETASVAGGTDDGQRVTVETLVLLDGVSKDLGTETIDLANESYAPLEIILVPKFRKVRLDHDGLEAGMDEEVGPTGDQVQMIERSKELLGGSRPEGIDVVLTLTNKDLFVMNGSGRSYGVAGMADCIGGVRFDEHSFAVSEGVSPWTETLGDEFPATAAAHEIGHLLGAHHHYGNCIEGKESGKPCTLMWTFLIQYASRNFGTLEAVTVRGHAVNYAN